jgi:hypothetical protein
MRKLLLASAAMLGATTGLASAQTAAPNPSQGQLVAPYSAFGGSNNNNNLTAAAAPGTVVVRLNGRIEVDVSVNSTFADKATYTGSGTSGSTLGTNSYKLQPQGVGSYFRLYAGIDGLTTNGIRYGGVAELRENWGAQGTSGSANSSGQTMFVRRAFTYIANDKVGLLRLGQTDGVIGLYDGGIITSQAWDAGAGNLNGGAIQQEIPTNVAPPFVWLSQAGAEYGNNKIVYLSPQFMGFDVGVQYAPSTGNSFANASGNGAVTLGVNGTSGTGGVSTGICGSAQSTCANLSSSSVAGDSARWINQYAAGVRYNGVIGPVALQAFALYEGAGKVSDSNVGAVKYDNLSFVTGGAAATFAGFTLAADYIGGAVNGQLGMRPSGGKSMNAEIVGLMYKIGALTLGANVGMIDSQGQATLTNVSQRHELETAVGGNYVLAPGLALVFEYMYMQRHQGNYDFVLAANNAQGHGGINNTVKAQGVMVGTVLTW